MKEHEDIQSLQRALDSGMQHTDVEHVVPVIVPREYFAMGDWPGPHVDLRSEFLGVTWSVLHPGQTMIYVNHERALTWDQERIDWRERARTNLEERSAEQLWTHEKRDTFGRLLWASMMHEDGLGSSRLLLRDTLLSRLEGDYRVGIPDRSCAVVIPLSAGRENLEQAREMVRKMFQDATTPMLRDLLDPADLELQW